MLIRLLGFRWHRLYAWSAAYGALADLLTFELKHLLHRVLVPMEAAISFYQVKSKDPLRNLMHTHVKLRPPKQR